MVVGHVKELGGERTQLGSRCQDFFHVLAQLRTLQDLTHVRRQVLRSNVAGLEHAHGKHLFDHPHSLSLPADRRWPTFAVTNAVPAELYAGAHVNLVTASAAGVLLKPVALAEKSRRPVRVSDTRKAKVTLEVTTITTLRAFDLDVKAHDVVALGKNGVFLDKLCRVLGPLAAHFDTLRIGLGLFREWKKEGVHQIEQDLGELIDVHQ